MADYGGGNPAREKPHSQPPGLAPGLSSVVTWLGQVPLRWRGAEAPIDLGRQHRPHPVRVSTAQDKGRVSDANCKLRS